MKRKIILLIMLIFLSIGNIKAQYGPVVSFSYDDGYPSWWDLGFPLFQEYGFPAVAYINADHWWTIGQGYDAVNKLQKMQTVGWEISSHTYLHDMGVTEPNVMAMKNWLDSLGFLNSGFAAPGHEWDHSKINFVKKYHPYYCGHGSQDGGNTYPIDLYSIKRFGLDSGVSLQDVKDALDDAVANNKWLIFLGHVIGNDGGWEQPPALLEATFNEVIARGIPVKTVREVINDQFPPGCVIECAVDTLQDPVLTYFEEGEDSFSTSVWNEYWHNTSWTVPQYIGSPAVYYHTSNDSLPVMKFYRNVPNGEYEVRATILTKDPGRTYRLFYSLNNENNPAELNVDVTQNSEVSLGTVTVTNGQFALYTQKADAISGGDGYVGWAFIKLITQTYVNAKVFLQGSYTGSGTMTTTLNSSDNLPFHHPYNDTLGIWNYHGSERVYNMPADIVDWVLVELRTGTAANTIVGSRAALLKSNGSIVDLDGSSQVKFNRIVPGNYYIVIRHRNHLPIMSANPVNLSFTNSSLYDFSTAQTQAYGTEPMSDLGNSVFGMIAGDANGDGSINAIDLNTYWIPQNGTMYDYQSKTADFNLDATVNATDLNTYWIPENGKATQVPN
ncbi:MAG TPA: polysaccharide deacetylase family protein [Ignavibacteriaceae bacterium]|nr:polysaccharide deacetylase family protein [Ignavibacteriaceae bacterium]